MKVTLEQWRMLKAVVDYGGFAHAAAAVHKSQSSIHHAIQKMERMLEVKLLEVQGRRAQLTDAGQLLLRRAEHLLESAASIDALAANLNAGVEPEIALAVDQTFPTESLAQALARFSVAYPNTRIQLYETVLSGAAEALEQERVDLAIASAGLSRFVAEPLLAVEFLAVAAPDYPVFDCCSADNPLSVDELARFRQIVTRDSAAQNPVDSGWLGADERWTVSNLATSVDMLCRGMGFAWVPMTRIRSQLDAGTLKPIPLQTGRERSIMLQLYYADARQQGPGIRCLAALLHEEISN